MLFLSFLDNLQGSYIFQKKGVDGFEIGLQIVG